MSPVLPILPFGAVRARCAGPCFPWDADPSHHRRLLALHPRRLLPACWHLPGSPSALAAAGTCPQPLPLPCQGARVRGWCLPPPLQRGGCTEWRSNQNQHHYEPEPQGGACSPVQPPGPRWGQDRTTMSSSAPALHCVPRRWQTCCSTLLARELGPCSPCVTWGCPGPEGQCHVRTAVFLLETPGENHVLAFSCCKELPTVLGLWLLVSVSVTFPFLSLLLSCMALVMPLGPPGESRPALTSLRLQSPVCHV